MIEGKFRTSVFLLVPCPNNANQPSHGKGFDGIPLPSRGTLTFLSHYGLTFDNVRKMRILLAWR